MRQSFCFLTIALWLQNVNSQSCMSTINALSIAESLITDTNSPREYKLCANTAFNIGFLNFDREIVQGQDALQLRPNLTVQCGDDGARSNRCIINGGDLQVDGTSRFGVTEANIENVVLKGLTFRNASLHNIWLQKPGDVTFEDCAFNDNVNAQRAPVLLDYFNRTDPTSELRTTFHESEFANNRYFGTPAPASLIIASSKQNRIIVSRSQFLNNNMTHNNTNLERNSFLIESSGPITVRDSCFENNQIGVTPVAIYGASTEQTLVENFGSFSNGFTCRLGARYETAAQLEANTPFCRIYDSDTCLARTSAAPTTSTPTLAPTLSPTASAAPSPSATPAPSTLSATTSLPSFAPTSEPTDIFSRATSLSSTTRGVITLAAVIAAF